MGLLHQVLPLQCGRDLNGASCVNLRDLLQASEASPCPNPLGQPPSGHRVTAEPCPALIQMLQPCTWRPQTGALLCRGGSSWTILVALLHSLQPPVLSPEHLLSTLQQQQVPAALDEASSSSAQPDASAAVGWTPQQVLAAAERQQASRWGVYERQRRALQVAQTMPRAAPTNSSKRSGKICKAAVLPETSPRSLRVCLSSLLMPRLCINGRPASWAGMAPRHLAVLHLTWLYWWPNFVPLQHSTALTT